MDITNIPHCTITMVQIRFPLLIALFGVPYYRSAMTYPDVISCQESQYLDFSAYLGIPFMIDQV